MNRRRFLTGCGQCALGLVLADTVVRSGRGAGGPGALEGGDPLALGVEQWTHTVCDLCGLGEPVFVGTRDGKPIAVKGIPLSTLGFGRLCPRARALVAAAASDQRATQPLLRRDPATKGTLEGLEPATWREALAAAVAGMKAARDRLGPGGVGVFASDAETCETYALLGRFARLGLGTDHLDTPARLDALHAYEACRQVFGAPANPASVDDVDAAELIVLVGGDLAESHPGLFQRVLDARRKGRAQVALLDARVTEAAAVADLHLRVRPGQELAVTNALAGRLADAGAAPAEARGWIAWARGQRAAGIEPAVLEKLAAAWRGAARIVTLVGPTALGSAAGAALARSIAQLHHATGRWGQPGRGVLFLPRGANATGVAAFGAAPGLLPAALRLDRPADRARYAEWCRTTPDRLPGAPGLPALEWPAALREGRMGALLVVRSNVAAEMPDALAWREGLTRAFVVGGVTHLPNETAIFADVVLPLALVAGESAGTAMTLDRRCQLMDKGFDPPGQARGPERIVLDLAGALFDAATVELVSGGADWTPYAEWDRWRALVAGTRFDAQGITSPRLGRELDVAWPSVAEDQPGSARLAPVEGEAAAYAPTPAPPLPRVAVPGGERPYLLVTGPLREHVGSRVRTGRTAELHYDAPSPQLEVHPEDGRALGLADGDWVTVESERGSATVRLWLTDRALPGVVFLPEHFGFVSDLQGGSVAQKEPEALAHRVTSSERLPGSDSPAGMMVAVSIRKAKRREMRQRGV